MVPFMLLPTWLPYPASLLFLGLLHSHKSLWCKMNLFFIISREKQCAPARTANSLWFVIINFGSILSNRTQSLLLKEMERVHLKYVGRKNKTIILYKQVITLKSFVGSMHLNRSWLPLLIVQLERLCVWHVESEKTGKLTNSQLECCDLHTNMLASWKLSPT